MKEIFDKVVVLDYGSQYNQLLTRRIRDLGVYCEMLSNETDYNTLINDESVKGIILSGGPDSVYDEDSLTIDPRFFDGKKPILGICYGMQLIAKVEGGIVEKGSILESGKTDVHVKNTNLLFKDIPTKISVFMSHLDVCNKVPSDYSIDALSENNLVASISNNKKNIYGIQFHPEVKDTDFGDKLLSNFLFNICNLSPNWKMENFIDQQIVNIRQAVGKEKVLCALSGGVDSSVVAALIHKAIGSQLVCVFVDHGLLRQYESESVVETFQNQFKMNLIVVDAKDRFLRQLQGVTDPEKKRKIIGKEFIEVFNEESNKLEGISYLAQGTIYADVIESGTKTAHVIKSHHNVGGLPKDLKFKLIEPIRQLFKDEVRELGDKLGLPKEITQRQPFPGPGLGVRVLGEVTEDKLRKVRESDYILRDEIAKAGLDKEIWQYFTLLPGVRSVGVSGDMRSYDDLIVIRAVKSVDGMTAKFSHIPWDVLERISTKITNDVKGVNRVSYDITSKPPATIEWE